MRKLIIILLVALSHYAHSQVDYFTIPKGDGTLIGMVFHKGPTNPNGSKNPLILWLHGQEGNGSAPANVNDTLRIDNVVLKGPPKLALSGPLPVFQIPGTTGSAGLRYFDILAPQNRTGLWDCVIVEKSVEYARTTLANISDTSLMSLWGYSLGGGGCQSCLRYPGVLPYFKYVAVIAPGYLQTADYPLLASSAVNIDMFACVNDELAPPTGSGRADAWVQGIKAQNPKIIPNYYRLGDLTASTSANAEHNRIVQIVVEDTTVGDSWLQTNGDTWQRVESPYHRALRFFGPRRLSLPLILFFVPFFNKKRRRAR